ncbi:MAG: RluA family pseudouridine synthase [Alphaproteobacteria bacterium]
MAEMVAISKAEEGMRLMRWILRKYPAMQNKDFYRLCRGGQLRINSKRCDGKEILHSGDVVRLPPTLQTYLKQVVKKTETGEKFSVSDLEKLRKSIIYDDDDIVVFNKPAGLAVQGGTGIKKSIDKMAEALFPYSKISLVHRLDKDTSGVLLVAKTQSAAQSLANEFQNKTAYKEYLALLNGDVMPESGVIDNYIAKGMVFDSGNRLDNGKGQKPQRAITEYKVLSSAKGCVSWVLFSPKTGRTHQLRIHSAFTLNAPIVGDDLYGRQKEENPMLKSVLSGKKLFLFAYKITFQHPRTKKLITLRAKLPDFMQRVNTLLEFNLPE